MHRVLKSIHLAACLFLLQCVPSQATIITYEVVNIAGNTYEYVYSVENDTLGIDLEEFAVFFDEGLFENLRAPVVPVDWNPLIIQRDIVLQDDGFYDALALVLGILPGQRLGGFSVWADFLGQGVPGSQAFDVVDPVSLAVLDSGFTVPANQAPIPEPSSIWLLGLGLLAAGVLNRRRHIT